MVGQGSPIAWKIFVNRCASRRIGRGTVRRAFLGLALILSWCISPSGLAAAEKTVRLRFAWGSGTTAKLRWTGSIAVDGGALTQLQPLGVETDASVAMRIDGSKVIVAPLSKRGFDGCDITVRADEQAQVRVELQNEQAQSAAIQVPLAEIISGQLREPLDALGSYFLARRSPGDVLRVLPTLEHYVFEPGEAWQLKLQPDLRTALTAGPVLLDVQLRKVGEEKPSWRSSRQIGDLAELDKSVDFDILCPAAEGAYRLTVTARPEEGFATRFVPGQQAKPIATRDVEFVVIDPTAKLPRLVDQWLPVLTIDPANPSWWQRLPSWAQVPRLRERTAGASGNVRPITRLTPSGELVELPPSSESSEPYWQSYTLPVREPGKPHLVEIEYPLGAIQELAISLVEPDAAGRVNSTQQDASLFSRARQTIDDGKLGVHRFVIWPRTRSPQLLLVNRHTKAPAQFGKIKLFTQDETAAVVTHVEAASDEQRLVAGYLAKPLLAQNFGAAKWLDPESGLSVHNWSSFLQGTNRLAQTLRLQGFNGVMISVAANGSALYPSKILNPSPRYDTAMLAASGQDPTRKDVLEMILRIFDREGIRVIPTVQFATPLPRLEALRGTSSPQQSGFECVGANGQTWTEENPTSDGKAPFYNPLNDRVQRELVEFVGELTTRYSRHPAMAGVGVQLSGEGFGLLPGLDWGFDDRTAGEFSEATGLASLGDGTDRFRLRANLLLGEHRQSWRAWRNEKLAQLYHQLAQQVASSRSDLRLMLTTEDLYSGHALENRVREAISDPIDFREILLDHGLDLTQLSAQPTITTLVPHRLSAGDRLQENSVAYRVNAAAEQGEIFAREHRNAEVIFHADSQFRLPSFDEQSPFGPERTYLTVTSQPQVTGAGDRRLLMTALASDDAQSIVIGGSQIGLNLDTESRQIMSALRQLPAPSFVTKTQRQQPVVMRVYRTGQATYIAVINEAPWPVQAEVDLTGSQPCDWNRLGNDNQMQDVELLAGHLEAVRQAWRVSLQPFDLQAWRFEDGKLRVGEMKISMSDLARQELEQRIQEVESRVGNLNIERDYPQLQNPGFELDDGSLSIVGWQPRQGMVGSISLESAKSRSGRHALRLRSEDDVGVAVQSHLFPTPNTGQLMVSAYLQFENFDEQSQLQIAVLDQDGGRRYHQVAVLGHEQFSSGGWSRYEFPLDDVPYDRQQQLRLHFYLRGNADLLVDDVQLYDLRFDDVRRRALVKRVYAAKVALEHGQLVDCLRVVDDYWSRYLLEHVPPKQESVFQATKQSAGLKPADEEDNRGIGSRLRGWVPSILR